MNVFHPFGESADLERGQCHIRLFVALPILCVWYLGWFLLTGQPAALSGLIGAGLFSVFALLHLLAVKRHPGHRASRQIIAITVDQTACFLMLLLTSEMGAIMAFLTLWVSLGNGIRFGVKWMALSASIATAWLIVLGLSSAYWMQHPTWIASLVLINTAIPAYVASLIRGFHEGQIKLAHYASEMEVLAMEDVLTGLPNRHALFGELERASSLAQRMGSDIAVLYFDLDGFKQVNDSLGHALGDMLLRETAGRVKHILRGEDVLARLGGDEFVVLLQVQALDDQVAEAAARILASIAAIDAVAGKPVEVTASVGIVVVSGEEAVSLGAEALVHVADQNMYAAKKAGKNQVVLTRRSTALRPLAKRA
jgi:diguanylate cyclase (GGDEF)-like protein